MTRNKLALSGGVLSVLAFSFAVAADKDDAKKPSDRQPPFLKDTPEEFIKRFDKNKDGFLTKDELPPRPGRFFDRSDANRDGKLDAKETAALLEVMRKRFAQGRPNPRNADRIVNSLLQRMDADKDGKISKKEAKNRIAQMFDQFDANKDGFLDKEELKKAAGRLGRGRGGNGEPRVDPNRPDFDALDLNADGRLTREELKGTRFLEAFDQIDANKDGKVDPKEFRDYLKKTSKLP